MNIVAVPDAPYLSYFTKYVRNESVSHALDNVEQEKLEVKSALKVELPQMGLQSQSQSTVEDKHRVQLLLDIFKSGTKLTLEEMAFLRQHTDGAISNIEKITRNREIDERKMKAAPSKLDWQNVVLRTLQQIANSPSSDHSKQQTEDQNTFIQDQCDDFKGKTDQNVDTQEPTTNIRNTSKSSLQQAVMAIVAYEQAKLLTVKK